MTGLSGSAPQFEGEPGPRATERLGSGRRIGMEFKPGLRCLALLLTLAALPIFTRAQESSQPESRPGDEFMISVDVNMVVLRATAQDRKHILASGLDKDDFRVYESGVLQEIKYFSHEDVPVTVGLVIDNSGSMASKRADVVTAALEFARSSNPRDQMFVVNFNERVFFGLPDDTPFTDQIPQLEVALSGIAARGETALYDAVDAALEHLKTGNRDKKVLIVISDGGDNASKHKLTQILAMAEQAGVIIYTIGIFDERDSDRNPRVLKRLAKNTGGEAFLPESTKDVVPICRRIARDIRNQYTIAYVPTNRKRDGKYRTIRVKARRSLLVRTRTGYFAPPAFPATGSKDN
jgi:Ca-activated chloride channel family protein